MAPYWSNEWGNPSSRQHRSGLSASAAVNLARRQLAECLSLTPERIVFTSGATEANNLALLGHARAMGSGHLISLTTEHHAVLDPLQQLQREGFSVTLLGPGPDGLITPEQLERRSPRNAAGERDNGHNEIGVLQPLAELAAICQGRGIRLHSDAAQALGHIPLEPDALGLDLVSLSAHKLYGPKGIGALVIREGTELQPLQWGGGQERGLRAGTLPTGLIVGFAAAAQLALADQQQRHDQLQGLRNQLWSGLQEHVPGVLLNGAIRSRLPHNLNITIPGVNGSRLHRALRPQLACSSGSACSNGAPSHVLQAIGRTRSEAEASLRLSLGRSTTLDEVNQVISLLTQTVAALQD